MRTALPFYVCLFFTLACGSDDSVTAPSTPPSSGGAGSGAGGAGSFAGQGGTLPVAGSGGQSPAGSGGQVFGGTAGSAGIAGTGGTGGSIVGGSGGGGTGGTSLNQHICGDSYFSPELMEGCDGGPEAGLADLCVACVPTDQLAIVTPFDLPADLPPVYLSEGRHSVAAELSGLGVVLLEELDGQPTLSLAIFNQLGVRGPTVRGIEGGTNVLWDSQPVVSALPDGTFVVAWTDFDGDGDELGIVMRQVNPRALDPLGPLVRVNETTAFTQQNVDILWTGTTLVLAWEDLFDPFTGPDLKARFFDDTLTPLPASMGSEHLLVADENDGVDGRVALSSISEKPVFAWRKSLWGAESIRVLYGETLWDIPLGFAGPEGELPAVVGVEDSYIVVAFSEGVDPNEDGLADSFQLRLAVLSASQSAPLFVDTWVSADTNEYLYFQEPNLVSVQGKVFLSYRAIPAPGTAHAEDVFVTELSWDADNLVLKALGDPTWVGKQQENTNGDQRYAGLAAAPYSSDGALVVAWQDLGGLTEQVWVSMTPVVSSSSQWHQGTAK